MTKLLLDEMLSGVIAEQLRGRGVDCVAVVEHPELVALPDERLLAEAAVRSRCLVTVNVKDFVDLAARWSTENRAHFGLILLTNNSFPRTPRLPGALLRALLQADLPGPDEQLFLRPVN